VQTLRIRRLSDEREMLLRLHYADAIPLDLFKQDQIRIMRELEDARSQLASVSASFDAIEQNLSKALQLAKDCHAAYMAATPEVRRRFNQAFFEKLEVHQDGEITHEFAEPFKLLLDPQLPSHLALAAGADADVRDTARGWQENSDTVFAGAAGSNFETLVGPEGLEPSTGRL
jgi:site-specific DNA recombinase